MRLKTCKSCRNKFVPVRQLQSVCSAACAIAIVRTKQAKRAAKQQRQDKQRIKTKAQYAKEAQIECNKYIRIRDKDLSCISCGRFHDGQYHASHYRSVGACPELRYCEWNIHKACSPCYLHKSGNILEYRIGLIQKIGIEKVEWLESKHPANHYSIEDLKGIKELYKQKTKQLTGVN